MIGSGTPGLRSLLSLSPTAQETRSEHSWNVADFWTCDIYWIFVVTICKKIHRQLNRLANIIDAKWWGMKHVPIAWWPLPPWHGLVTVYSLHQDIQSQLVLPQPNPPHPSAWQTELLWAEWRAGNFTCTWWEFYNLFSSHLIQTYTHTANLL